MSVLARKISRAKWEASEDLGDGEIQADALSADLRTNGNALSFWRCASGEDVDLRDAVLALAAVAERVDRMDVAWVPTSSIEVGGIATENTPGDTPVESLRASHVDVVRLDLRRLGRIAELIAAAVADGHHQRLTKKQVVRIVARAVQDELVSVKSLEPRVQDEVRKALDAVK